MKGKKVRFTEGSFTAFCREVEVFVWMGIDLQFLQENSSDRYCKWKFHSNQCFGTWKVEELWKGHHRGLLSEFGFLTIGRPFFFWDWCRWVFYSWRPITSHSWFWVCRRQIPGLPMVSWWRILCPSCYIQIRRFLVATKSGEGMSTSGRKSISLKHCIFSTR